MFKKLFNTKARALQAELDHATRMLAVSMRRSGVRSDEVLIYERKIASLKAAIAH